MKEAIDKFRVQHRAAVDSVEFVKKALDRPISETSWKGTEQDEDWFQIEEKN
jgi:hypothetical protein